MLLRPPAHTVIAITMPHYHRGWKEKKIMDGIYLLTEALRPAYQNGKEKVGVKDYMPSFAKNILKALPLPQVVPTWH